jgi:hypothetical protein
MVRMTLIQPQHSKLGESGIKSGILRVGYQGSNISGRKPTGMIMAAVDTALITSTRKVSCHIVSCRLCRVVVSC